MGHVKPCTKQMLPSPRTDLLLLIKTKRILQKKPAFHSLCTALLHHGVSKEHTLVPLQTQYPRGCLGLGSWDKHPNPGNSQTLRIQTRASWSVRLQPYRRTLSSSCEVYGICSAPYKLHRWFCRWRAKEGLSKGPGAQSGQEAAKGRGPPAQNLLQ